MSHHSIDPEIVNAGTKPEMGWENRDTEQYVKPVALISFWFFAVTAIIMALMIPTMNAIIGRGLTFKTESLNGYVRPAVPSKPNPLIQGYGTPAMDIFELRKAEGKAVSSYGWVDEKAGIAHIPIEEALQEVSREGLSQGGAGTP